MEEKGETQILPEEDKQRNRPEFFGPISAVFRDD